MPYPIGFGAFIRQFPTHPCPYRALGHARPRGEHLAPTVRSSPPRHQFPPRCRICGRRLVLPPRLGNHMRGEDLAPTCHADGFGHGFGVRARYGDHFGSRGRDDNDLHFGVVQIIAESLKLSNSRNRLVHKPRWWLLATATRPTPRGFCMYKGGYVFSLREMEKAITTAREAITLPKYVWVVLVVMVAITCIFFVFSARKHTLPYTEKGPRIFWPEHDPVGQRGSPESSCCPESLDNCFSRWYKRLERSRKAFPPEGGGPSRNKPAPTFSQFPCGHTRNPIAGRQYPCANTSGSRTRSLAQDLRR